MKFWARILVVLIPISSMVFPTHASAANLYSFTSHTFTNCGATGNSGPTLAQCKTAYSAAAWSTNSAYLNLYAGIESWTAPATGSYKITAAGAAGAGGAKAQGLGAIIRATVTLTKGNVYRILVGQAGSNGSGGSGGGGGGTYFADASNNPIIVAGGGAGAYDNGVGNASRANGQTTTSGSLNADGSYAGGTSGNAGASAYYPAGGAGFYGNSSQPAGASQYGYTGIALSFVNGGTGGNTCCSAFGGFGGGGGTHGNTGGGGGGGGYSGGAGGPYSSVAAGGGGGSFVIAGATNIATSNGSYAGSSTGITNLNSYNGTYQSSTIAHGYLTIEYMPEPVTISIASSSGSNKASARIEFPIVATLSLAGGTVTFYALGKTIPGCIKIYTSTTSATCNWKPSVKGVSSVYAKVLPDNGAATATSPASTFLISKRTTLR